MIRRAAIFLICLPILHQTLSLTVTAAEINLVIEGNGESSSNNVQVENNNSVNVEQNNNAQINNDVNIDSNTGNNSSNDNGGEVGIETGNVSTEVNIENQNINSNHADVDNCCNNDTNLKISGNGSKSSNTINAGQNINRNVNQNNNANINNNVKVNSNTGYNSANYNSGNVTIKTGNVYAETNIVNKNINNSYAKVAVGSNGVHAVIIGNGEDSTNIINYVFNNNSETNVENTANIFNNLEHILNTGHNSANGNLGDVAIMTGDIESIVNIENKDINTSTAITTCLCSTPENPENPEEPEEPKKDNPPSSKVQSSSGSSNGGQGGGNGGAILPVTGGLSLTYVLTILFFLMFLMGLYLRFYSGKSPPAVTK